MTKIKIWINNKYNVECLKETFINICEYFKNIVEFSDSSDNTYYLNLPNTLSIFDDIVYSIFLNGIMYSNFFQKYNNEYVVETINNLSKLCNHYKVNTDYFNELISTYNNVIYNINQNNVIKQYNEIVEYIKNMLMIESIDDFQSYLKKYPDLIIAGGAVLNACTKSEIGLDNNSDIDFWITSNDNNLIINCINDLMCLINRDYLAGINGSIITIITNGGKHNIQFINTSYENVTQILNTFDNSGCQIAINYNNIFGSIKFIETMKTGEIEWFDLEPKPHRVNKYRNKGFILSEYLLNICSPDNDDIVVLNRLKNFHYNMDSEEDLMSHDKKFLEFQMGSTGMYNIIKHYNRYELIDDINISMKFCINEYNSLNYNLLLNSTKNYLTEFNNFKKIEEYNNYYMSYSKQIFMTDYENININNKITYNDDNIFLYISIKSRFIEIYKNMTASAKEYLSKNIPFRGYRKRYIDELFKSKTDDIKNEKYMYLNLKLKNTVIKYNNTSMSQSDFMEFIRNNKHIKINTFGRFCVYFHEGGYGIFFKPIHIIIKTKQNRPSYNLN